MQDHSRSIKGMSIAIIVISAISILFSFIGNIFISILMNEYPSYGSYFGYDSYYGYDYIDMFDEPYAYLLLGLGSAFIIWAIVCNIATLIASILTLRYAGNPDRLGLCFGWSIAGAIICFLNGSMVSMVLFIIIAVFANKDKNAFKNANIQNYDYGYSPDIKVPYSSYSEFVASNPVDTGYGSDTFSTDTMIENKTIFDNGVAIEPISQGNDVSPENGIGSKQE